MKPRLSRAAAPFTKRILAIVLFAYIIASPVYAFQNKIRVEATGPARKVTNQVAPEYPELAIRNRVSGTARVEITVAAEGSVKQIKEVGGNPLLLDALVRAVKQWKYEPASTESVMDVKAAFSYY